MKTIKETFSDGYFNIEKSKWGEGEWQNEPDKIKFKDELTGYPCLILRTDLGHLCGYVDVSKDHPFYGGDYNNFGNIYVHGGITFSRLGHRFYNSEENDSKKIWWFGFDCAHCYDFLPGVKALLRQIDNKVRAPNEDEIEVYRNIEYVTNEVKSLARQLKEAHV